MIAKQIVEATFNQFDSNKDGHLSWGELKDMIHAVYVKDEFKEKMNSNNPESYEAFIKEQADILMKQIDIDEDNKVTLKELEIHMVPMIEHALN